MTRTKTGVIAAAFAGAALACVMMFAVDGMAQRRARGGTPYVRATAGNITINMPVQAAGEEAKGFPENKPCIRPPVHHPRGVARTPK